MSYVMVPVPKEYVSEVMEFILNASAHAALTPWELDTLVSFWGDLDEVSRSLIARVASAAMEGRGLPDTEAASLLGISVRAISRLVRDINDQAHAAGHHYLIPAQAVPVGLSDGRRDEQRVITMRDETGKLVRTAEDLGLLPGLGSSTIG